MKRKQKSFNDQSNKNYDIGNDIINNTEVLISNFCGYIDAYILGFKNFALFVKWTTQNDGTTIGWMFRSRHANVQFGKI